MPKTCKSYFNKKIHFLVICLITLSSLCSVYGQNSLRQASPSANFSGTFNPTVDLYTGKIGVGFDLIDLKFAGEDLSLRLNYLAGNGVKANDLPSWVGLGWGLDAPGYIYRKVKGKPDELQTYKSQISKFTSKSSSFQNPLGSTLTTTLHSQNKNYLTNYAALNVSDWNSPSRLSTYTPSGSNYSYWTSGWQTQDGNYYQKHDITEINIDPTMDLVPDEFIVQIGELSGTFYKSHTGDWTFVSNNNLSCNVEVFVDNNYPSSVLKTPGVITKIVLTSTNGMRYTFDGDFESTKVSTVFTVMSPPGGNHFYDLTPTLWNISKIENLNTQEEINYTYKPSYFQLSNYNSAFGHSNLIIYDNYINSYSWNMDDWTSYSANYTIAQRTKLLDAITCSNGYKITFNSTPCNQSTV
jgi:hypothetical protein